MSDPRAPLRLGVDRQRCVGAGMCALTAPAVFDQDEEEGLVVLLSPARVAFACATEVSPGGRTGSRTGRSWVRSSPRPWMLPLRVCSSGAGPPSFLRSSPRP
ncbi:ferredoxin [Streptomyces uncialis]|uniref:ferredoxin n=1 Tax=Streptomyces uncialis TaxID=1048205 RepID=UPI0036522F32